MPVLQANVLYRLIHLLTNRPAVEFLTTSRATFPDTYGGNFRRVRKRKR